MVLLIIKPKFLIFFIYIFLKCGLNLLEHELKGNVKSSKWWISKLGVGLCH